LIDVVLSADRNVTQKKAEKKLMKSLCIEIQRKWNIKCMIIPVVIGYTGIVTVFKDKFGNHTRKTLSGFSTKDNYIRNIT